MALRKLTYSSTVCSINHGNILGRGDLAVPIKNLDVLPFKPNSSRNLVYRSITTNVERNIFRIYMSISFLQALNQKLVLQIKTAAGQGGMVAGTLKSQSQKQNYCHWCKTPYGLGGPYTHCWSITSGHSSHIPSRPVLWQDLGEFILLSQSGNPKDSVSCQIFFSKFLFSFNYYIGFYQL